MSEYKPITENYDIAVVGAGHAGCEAALSCARLGLSTVIFTVSVESIALMPCNPNIGGSSKGHLVREIDALGGEMGKNIDKTFIQSKMLNISKGPAVHSLRAQADKAAYTMSMRHTLENQENLTIVQQETAEILLEGGTETKGKASDSASEQSEDKSGSIEREAGTEVESTGKASGISQKNEKDSGASGKAVSVPKIVGVRTVSGAIYHARAVILCTGVYLKSRCIYGEVSQYTGPNGLMAANHLSDSLRACGIRLVRFKTGTPARIDGRTIDYDKMAIQPGDETVVPFSWSTDPESVQIEQVPCYLTYTNEKTHQIIRDSIDRSPLYSGAIHATGPRYCPSIEDKVVKFPEKDRHQVFIEPEGRYTHEMYIDGMSSSMPEDVQHDMYHSVPGLEHAKIVRNAYAIEYDCLAPGQLKNTLEFRAIHGLFSAGQFNGSSGYEEAAAQGLIAGINASMEILGRPMLVLDRSEAYIGVLIDDLVTKENTEPYRMMTSRAEYRLLLRQDNADLRLRRRGYEVGLVSQKEMDALENKEAAISAEIERFRKTVVPPSPEVNHFLEENGSTPLTGGASLSELIKRPELDYDKLAAIDTNRAPLPRAVCEQVSIEIKYEGYIARQRKQVEQFKKLEKRLIPEDFDFEKVGSLRIEARQKLVRFRPSSIGQASRIAGVTPADITMLLVSLEQTRRKI